VCQARDGRKVGGSLNVRDISSDYCQQRKSIVLDRLDHFDSEDQAWSEVLVESKECGPAETAICRLDFGSWMKRLPRRLRKIAMFLANGETTTAAAAQFGLSQGRISQIRGELFSAWKLFQGEEPVTAAA
jgi:hypothetical protein